MLKPNYFNGKSDRVVSLYQSFEDYLIQDIAKFLINAGEIGGKADREIFLLEQLGLSQDDIASRLATLTAQSKEEVRAVLQDSVMTSFSNDKAVLDKYFSGEFSPLDKPSIRAVMDAEWAKTCGELSNLTQTTMEQFNMDVVGLLDQTEILVSSGGVSYNEAVSQILDNYAKVGMMVDYPTGARRSLDSAVRCAVVTSMNQTAGQVTNKYIAEGGIEYVLISAHTGARYSDKGGLYSHAEWQGKAYKIRGSEEGFPNLLESTGYDIDPETGVGTVVNPHGLHGYNCRHSHQPWDKDLDNPWINPDGTPKIDPEDSREVYENTQKQRYMERSIRETKRQLVMKQAEIDNLPDDSLAKAEAMASYDKLAYRLRQKNQAYNQFCSEKQLVRQQDRLKTGGFTKADSDKARGRATAWKNDKVATEPKTKDIDIVETLPDGTVKVSNPTDNIELRIVAGEYKKLTLEEFKNIHHKITREERSIIYGRSHLSGYINSGDAKYINADIRNGVELTQARQKVKDTLSTVINKNEMPLDVEVIRYVNDDALKNIIGVDMPKPSLKVSTEDYVKQVNDALNNVKKGYIDKENNFLSASMVHDKNVMTNKRVEMHINVNKGKKCYITSNDKESEVIFDVGTELELQSVVYDTSQTPYRYVVYYNMR